MGAATIASPPPPGRLMPSLVRWHVGLGELALRVFWLHLLWIMGSLAGAIVLGLFPATAALHAVLRADQLEHAREAAGADLPHRGRVWTEFWAAWRSEFRRANLLGTGLVLAWAVIVVDRWVLAGQDLGALAPWVSGLVVLLTILLTLVTLTIWPLAAHFVDPLRRILRMTLTLLITRPLVALSIAFTAALTVWIWQTVPGLAPVFGIAFPCWAISRLIWRSGTMPLR